jgi:hypothetical protein
VPNPENRLTQVSRPLPAVLAAMAGRVFASEVILIIRLPARPSRLGTAETLADAADAIRRVELTEDETSMTTASQAAAWLGAQIPFQDQR